MTVSEKESTLLTLLRAKRYTRIEVEMRNGEIDCIHVHEEISPSGAIVEDIVRNTAHQTVTLTKHDGDLVRINRRMPIKL